MLEGEGVIEVEGRRVSGTNARCVCVPAGSAHSLYNDADALWTLRITCQDRVYPRHVGKLMGRAIRKRVERWIGK